MKRFVCADVNPGCEMVFQGLDDSGIIERAMEHSAAAHGGGDEAAIAAKIVSI